MHQKPRAMRDSFIDSVVALMAGNDRIFFVTADFGSPALDRLRSDFPDRYLNVGIAEQNLVNVATGIALEGYVVYAYAIAPFITMRCYEQTRVNLSILSQLKTVNVNLVGVGAGLSYDVSGPSHHCLEDLSIMRVLPNMTVFSPSDFVLAADFAAYTVSNASPKYLRFDSKVLPQIYRAGEADLGKGFAVLREGGDVCVISTGFMTHKALAVAAALEKDGTGAGVIDLFMITSFDRDELASRLSRYRHVVTIEEGFIERGGMDSIIADLLRESGHSGRLLRFGIKNNYSFEIGGREVVHRLNGAGSDDIHNAIRDLAAE